MAVNNRRLKGKRKVLTRDIVNEIDRLNEKNPLMIMEEYYRLLELIQPMILYKKQNDEKTTDLISKIGLTQTKFYCRIHNSDLWTRKELIQLFKKLGFTHEKH